MINIKNSDKYLKSNEKFKINLGLKNIKSVLNKLKNPEKELKCIHIAGTNGKGSTAAIINEILVNSGYKTGLYTSPHLVEYKERIKINNKNISKKRFNELINVVEQTANEINVNLTEFEILTACAFLYFKEQKTDIVILETGLGGRLDATNVIENPLMSIITSISKDHENILGNTITKIAHEKAGIIKQNSKCIISKDNKGYKVIQKIAEELNTEVITPKNCKISYKNNKNYINYNKKDFEFNLLGLHQGENASLALCGIEKLKEVGYKITNENIKNGLKNVIWKARMQYYPEYNLLIDGSHNPDGIKKLRENIDYYFKNYKIHWYFGVIDTKNYEKMIKILFKDNEEITLVRFNYPKAVPPEKLITKINNMDIQIKDIKEIGKELSEKKEGTIKIVCGSLYYAGELYAINKFLN